MAPRNLDILSSTSGLALPVLAAALLQGALPASAQEAAVIDPAPLAACIEEGGGNDCISIAATACITAAPGAASMDHMVQCFALETDWWEAALEASYDQLLHSERAGDEWAQSTPERSARPSGVEAIEAMQSSWSAWRDATCAYEQLQFWSTDGEPFTAAVCRLHLTGEHALRLRVYLAGSG